MSYTATYKKENTTPLQNPTTKLMWIEQADSVEGTNPVTLITYNARRKILFGPWRIHYWLRMQIERKYEMKRPKVQSNKEEMDVTL